MNLLLTLFLLTVSVLLTFHYHKNSEIILSSLKPKQRHIQEKSLKQKRIALLGFIFFLLIIIFFIFNNYLKRLEHQNQLIYLKIDSAVTKLSSKQIEKSNTIDSVWRNKYVNLEKEIKKQERFSFFEMFLLIISALTFIISLVLKKRKLVYISAITGIIATATSVLTKSQLIKASLTLKPEIEFSPEVNINTNIDTTKTEHFSYDTLIVKTFEPGFDTLQKDNNLSIIINTLKNTTNKYDLIQLTGMVDQRSLGPTSKRIFETNKNLAKARARFVQKAITEKVIFTTTPTFDLRTSEPNDFTIKLDTAILSTNRIVIIICRRQKNE